jgi:amino acid adenylation domain-containing protein/non-ribosomal peptide synthase protein (TIGR01720 family)
MSRKNIEDIYPLSPLQQGILFHTLLAADASDTSGPGVYFIQHNWTLEGALDVPAFVRAFQEVVDRHPILRTAFVWDRRDRPMQVVRERVKLPFEQLDLRALDEGAQAARILELAAADRARGFELSRAPLMRVSLLRLRDDVHRVVWSSHHLLLDGWSTPLVTREVFALYDAYAQGLPPPALPRPRPYGDYIGWLQKQDAGRAEAFFRPALRGLRAPTPLGVDRPAHEASGAGAEAFDDRRVTLPEATSERLTAFVRQHQLTVSTVLQAAWALVLSRYSGEEDVLFGVTVSGRSAPVPGIEKMVGLFINTLALRTRAPADETALAWLQGLQAQQGDLRELEHTSLVDAQGWSEIPRGTPLFESILVLENYPFDPTVSEGRKALTLRAERTYDRANFPLTVVVALRRGVLLRITYDRRRFDDGTVERMLGHLAAALEGLIADPHRRLWQIPLLTEAERRAVVLAAGASAVVPARACVHRLFEAQVDRAPDAPAATCEGRTLTYRELDERANRLAHRLRALGVRADALVGLATSRSLDMLVGILGILKAGGAYLPLDPEYPRDRLAFMMEDAAASILLTESAFVDVVPAGAATVLRLDADWPSIASEPADRLPGGSLEDLAYVIYTSGSTGKPKGAMVTHANVARLFDATHDWYRFGPSDVWTMFHSYAFDFSVWEIWGALLYGGRVVIVPYWVSRAPDAYYQLLGAEGVTVLNQTPSAFRQLMRAEEAASPASVAALRLRYVIFGGEALDIGDLRPWWDRHGDTTPQLVNMYGITETTVHVTYRPVGRADLARPAASVIGTAIPDLSVHVLDAHREPVPFGVAGELYVGGAGVSRGYLNRPELTADRFLTDPFSAAEGARLYRTGDLARRRSNGDIEYLGRIDHQVKIRGFRIELGEIEAALDQHPSVREAVVLAREDVPGDKRLVAYLVAASGSIPVAELRGFIKERLPDYMVPSAFVVLDVLPLTENGKVDRRALPAPGAASPSDRAVVPPRGPVEEALAGIFAEILKLDPSRVGAHDGFFELGGHSLLATSAVGRVRAAFSIELPLRALFEASTPAELAVIVQAALSSGAAAAPPLVRAPAAAAPELSFAQERLWFLAQLEPDDPSYNIPLSLRLEGPLDVAALERALAEIVRRHDVLRTAIVDAAGRPTAVVHAPVGLPLTVLRLDALPAADREDAARSEASAEARRPFDLSTGRPVRATLLTLGEGVHQLLLTMHHIVSDGWSLGVLYRELSSLYAAFAAGEPSPLPDLPIQYADHAAWQRRFLSGEVLDGELGWWRKRLEGAPRALDLPADRPRPPTPSHRGARTTFTIDAATVKAVKDLSRREGVTPFMTLLAAFDALLHRYTGHTDLLVGTPIAGRTRAETEALVGFFVNTLVIRTELAADLPFKDLLQRVKDASLGAFAHQDMPFEQLVREIEPDRDPSRSPLFQVSFTLQAEPVTPPALAGLAVRRAAAANTTAKFDLTLGLFDGPSGMAAMLEYATDLFDAATIERLAGHFTTLLAGAARTPERRLFELPLLSAEETQSVVVAWNASAAPWPEDATIHELFEAHVDRAPDATALVFEDRALTYAELDRRANQLAHRLRALGVGPESLVGISMLRSPEMIVALLGTLKAGGAWVPLDPAYPLDRLAFMIEDSGVAVLLTQASVAGGLPPHRATVIRLDADWAAIAAEPGARPAVDVGPDDAAYVIYTSGSTGRPKGVIVEHHGLGNVAAVHHRAYGIGPGSRVLQFSSMNFDASVWETVMALLNGATLVLAPQDALLPGPDLLGTLTRHAVTIMTVPPSVLAALPHAELPALRTIVVAGEACSEDLVSRWAPGRQLWNAYGPTETSICASMAECFSGGGKPTIGGPIANAQLYVLDANLQPAPIGVPGELCVGGVGLARGYLKRPELTAEKFVQSPFEPGKRIYRTGDLARWLPDANVEFLGRIDHQVKVRGFRIELGEIDAVLRQHEGVSDAVTLAREDRSGDKRLVAYVVAASDPGPSTAELRAFLEARLPAHMVPAAFVRLATMPLTPNGKVDRRALPAPEIEARVHVAPRGPIEETLAGVFAEVLQIAGIGAHDGFFELGGHSLLATQAIARVRAAFSIELPLRALFEAPTPAGLAVVVQAAIAAGQGIEVPPLTPAPRAGDLPLSFAQERLWFLAQLEPDDPSYVIPSAMRLRGRLDVAALRRALSEIARRHEILRTRFASRGGRPVQIIGDATELALPITDLGGLPPEERLDAARRLATAEVLAPFDLAAGCLYRAKLLRLDEDDHALVVTLHHITSDGWSQAIFHRELGALYGAFAQGLASPLADLSVQYVDYAVWQRGWLSGGVEARQLAYWKQQLGGAPRALDLPADRARPPVPSHRGDKRSFAFPPALVVAFEAIAREEGATLFMTLLAAFEILLHRLTGQSDLVVGTPIAGRTRAETEGLIGFFINNLVLRTEVTSDLGFRALVRRVREVCLGAYAHQDTPFERLVQELSPERDLSRSPLFQVMFTLQTEPRDGLTLDGLEVERLRAETPTAKIDLSLAMSAGPRGLGGVIEYATDLFDAATIDRLVAQLGVLLAGIAARPDARVAELPILAEGERRRLVETWNETAADHPAGATIHALFEAHAARTPDALALVFQDQRLTYRELDERANRLANRLRALGVGAERLVGISVRRSPEMIVAVLGTLKAGGAYVPLDPAYPRDRLDFMIQDSGVGVILTQDAVVAGLPAHGATTIRLDADWPAIAAESAAPPASGVTAAHAAYVIYTSGSTGRPKGVVVEHHGLGNVAAVHHRAYGIGPGSRVLQFSSMNFDASVWEMVMALLNGATLVLAPQDALLPGPELTRTLLEHAVGVITVPPSVLAALPHAAFPALHTIVVAGEACAEDLVDRWAPGRRLWNAYGPTETTICASMAECVAGGGKPTIGRPIANAQIYVVDAQLEPVPIGVPGELLIGGVGLARGYLNRLELTAEKFVASPFRPGEKLYRTGDLARWLPDRNLDFLGRIDHQVKLRGFRIELGEIDAVLRQHAGVADAVAVVREDHGEPRLVAYVVPAAEAAPTPAELRAYLREKLPEHMIPSALVPLGSMPLTPNGKIDRRALPAPDLAAPERAHVAPRGPVEEALAGIFADVLHVPLVGAHDGFFDLGGHSLLATQAIARIRDALGVELPLRTLFDDATPAGLAVAVQASLAKGRGLTLPPLTRAPRDGDLPLSFSQERLWFLDQLEQGSAAYVVPLAMRLTGKLDGRALSRTLDELVRRHDVLRTTFSSRDGRPVAVVHAFAGIEMPVTRRTEVLVGERDGDVRRLATEDARQPLSLATGPVFRAQLLAYDVEDHALLLTMHHVVADAWALGVMNHELATLYDAFSQGRPSPLPELALQYTDFAAWQRRFLSGEALEAQLAYWRAELAGAPSALDLPTDRPRPPAMTYAGSWRRVTVPADVLAALNDLSRREGATLFMTLLAAFDVLLARYTGQDDLVVGTPVAGRRHAETEAMIGFFINTLVLRARVSDDEPFVALLQRVKETCLSAYAHQDTPFERLVQELDPERDPSRSPLFQVLFSMQNTPRSEMAMAGLVMRSVGAEAATSKYDLTLAVGETPRGLAVTLEYRTDLFDATTIDRMLGHYAALLTAIAARADAPVGDLSILDPAERHRLLVEWNDTAVELPAACVHELFVAQASRTPDAVAAVAGAAHLTYRALDARSNQLARYLRSLGVGPDTLVGLCIGRSLDAVVGILGILKAGGAYVPLDPTYPVERLAWMLEDSAVPIVLTLEAIADELPAAAMMIRLDADAPTIAAESDAALAASAPAATPESLAYVIYTSGSTGKPKGVLIQHRGLTNYLLWAAKAYDVASGNGAPVHSSLSFDLTVTGLFTPLLAGRTVELIPEQGEIEALASALSERGGYSLVKVTPAHLEVLDQMIPAASAAAATRAFVIGGEALSWEAVAFWRRNAPATRLVNEYGPTETVVGCAVYDAAREGSFTGSVPIGRPIANTRLYVLDKRLRPVPIGVPGELYIGGAGVARGYLNRPELTRERFLDDPFGGAGKLYKTGDLCRYLPSGDLDFLGRIDHQVKLRGYRIELGEIESVLAQHPGVGETIVLAREDQPGDKRLVGYFVATDEPAPAAAELRAFLASRLPEYMVPTAFVALATIPLTPNGKVDRRALPAPDARAAEGTYVAPRSPVEEVLAGIWADVLDMEQVSVHDDFFALGGHSLLATQVMGRMVSALGVELPLASLFEAPTVAGLAERVGAALAAGHGVAAPPIVALPHDGALPLSFAQERLWFLDRLEPGDPSYLVPAALRLEGPLDASSLARALTEIARRHEILRTSFAVEDGKPVGVVRAPAPIEVPVTRWPALDPADRVDAARREIAAESRRPFDLAAAPMLRARLFELGDDDHVLSLTMHHIVSDAWTEGVWHGELAVLYEAFAAGRPSPLPELAVQYADYAAWQRRWLSGDVLDRQLAYWRSQLDRAPAALDLPTDRPRPPVQSHAGGRRTVVFPAALRDALEAFSRREGVTLFMTLLAAFDVLLARHAGQDDVVIGSPIANRTRAETETLMGFFVNTLVLRAEIPEGITFRALLRRVRDTCLGAYAHQDMPFERLVTELAPERDLGRTPLFQVMFAFQNAGGGGVKLPGLSVRNFGADTLASKFDLTLIMGAAPGGLVASMEYAADLFDAPTIERLLEHLGVLLAGAVQDPDQPVWALPLLAEPERRTVLEAWNDTAFAHPGELAIHEVFSAQAARTPDALALSFEGRTVTYRELDERANRLAHALRRRGIGPESLVGVCLSRGVEMVVALYGVLKAGGAYVPFDPEYPRDRLAFMLTDARVSVMLTEAALVDVLPASDAAVIRLDADWDTIAAEPADAPARAGLTLDTLAYVIYTSGSTGRPKGAMNAHRGILNRLQWMQHAYGLGAADRVLQKTPFSFDVSVWELFWPLMYGARLVLARPGGHREPGYLLDVIEEAGITTMHFVPSMLNVFLDELERQGASRAGSLRRVMCSGEALPPALASRFFGSFASVELHNLYGPTEAAVDVTAWACERGAAIVPIGRPIHNTRMYVLDAHLGPAPIGVRGELYIGGVQVGRGYLERPELTRERFIDDPFAGPPARLYRTGDVARWLPSGALEYVGRADFQVKLRGFRVELGEIESTLLDHPSVREAIVLAREDTPGATRLVGYLACSDGPAPTVAELRAFLQVKLPEYMIPAAFVLLPALPLTASGKVDRKALPAPEEGERLELGAAFVAPETLAEQVLAAIWAAVLRREDVGVHDNFFAVGGDSILSIQIVARAQQAGLRITPRQLFQHPTIAELAAVAGTSLEVQAEQGAVTGPVPLAPIQRWWLEQDVAEPQHWNQAFFLELREPMDASALEDAFGHLLAHHDALRLRLARTDTGPRLTAAAPGGRAPFQRVDLSAVADADLQATIEHAAADAQASLDLASGPLVRVVLFDPQGDRPQRLLIVSHHLAIDGVSWRVLLEDLWTAYAQRRRGEAVSLPPKTTSFKHWSERLGALARTDAVAAEESYWLSDVRRLPARLPVDHAEGDNTEQSARSVVVALSPEETQSLLREVPEAYQTQINDILLTALARAWQAFTGSAVAVVDLEGHGREHLFEDVDLTRTVGWFTALYPLVLELPETGGTGAAIKAIKEQVRDVPGRGVGYGLLRYLRDGEPIARELAELPQAEASFNYLGQLDQALPEAAPFRWARESSGPSHSPRARRRYLLDVTASVAGGRLSVQWRYSEARHLRGTVERLAEGYLAELRALIAHCLSPEAGGYTPSDFQEQGLSQNVIDMLAALDDDADDQEPSG